MMFAVALIGLILVAAGALVGNPYLPVLVGSGAFLLLGGLMNLILGPYTVLEPDDHGHDAHGHGGHH